MIELFTDGVVLINMVLMLLVFYRQRRIANLLNEIVFSMVLIQKNQEKAMPAIRSILEYGAAEFMRHQQRPADLL